VAAEVAQILAHLNQVIQVGRVAAWQGTLAETLKPRVQVQPDRETLAEVGLGEHLSQLAVEAVALVLQEEQVHYKVKVVMVMHG
jgi:hypothetical protein